MFAKELAVAQSIAREAGVIMLQYFDADQKVETKSDNSPVTIADKLINSLAIERLLASFPDDGIIGEEESTAEYGMGRKWFCDPIDGTVAYICGTPTAAFSLGLVLDGKPVMGVVYDPFLDRLYTGVTGEPSRCNGNEIKVSNVDINSGNLAVSSHVSSLPKTKYFQRMIDDNIRILAFNGAVHKTCLVATGRIVGYVENGLNPHDTAAVQVILEGAGGRMTSIDGKALDYCKPFKGAIASNSLVHEKIVKYCA